MRVLPLRRVVGQQAAEGVAFLLAVRLLPVRLDRLPEVVVEPLVVGVAVLHHDGRDPLRMPRRQAIADRGAVVLHVEGISASGPTFSVNSSITFARLSKV